MSRRYRDGGVQFRKVKTFEDILSQELGNAKQKVGPLAERYVFQPIQVGETENEVSEQLEEAKDRLHESHQRDLDERMGDAPLHANRARGERGERGEQGPPGADAPTAVIAQLSARLDASEAARERARQAELENELLHARAEAERHAATQKVVADQASRLSSLNTEVTLLRNRAPIVVPSVDHHARQAAEHLARQASDAQRLSAEQHAQNLQFVQHHFNGIAEFASTLPGRFASALAGFQPPPRAPPEIPMEISSAPRPPPGGAGGRIKRAAAAIENQAKVPKAPAPAPPAPAPPAPPPPPAPRHSMFGPPISHEERLKKEEESRKKWDAVSHDHGVAQKKKPPKKPPSMVKMKNKQDAPTGLVVQGGAKDPSTKLTKHGRKPVIPKDSPPDKPHVHLPRKRKDLPTAAEMTGGARGTKRKAPEPPGPDRRTVRARRVAAQAV